MSWTTPTTRSTGDLITAAIWNADLVDNLNFLYGSLPSARAYHNASQSIAASTTETKAFNSERWDNDIIHDTASNNSRLTCKRAGKYLIILNMAIGAPSSGSRETRIDLVLNGATIIDRESDYPGAVVIGYTVATIYDLAINDYVEHQVWIDAATSAWPSLANGYPEFMMHRIGG